MDTPNAEPEANRKPRALDLTALKALAHPLRVQLIGALSQYGPATASGLAQRLGESSGATSYHLRQLARHGFVREVVGRGHGRERWWETTPGGISLDPREVSDTVAGRAAADLVMREWQQNSAELFREFLAQGAQVLDPAWIEASAAATANLRLTVDQLAELSRAVDAVIEEFRLRQSDENLSGSRPVQIQFNAFPLVNGEETP